MTGQISDRNGQRWTGPQPKRGVPPQGTSLNFVQGQKLDKRNMSGGLGRRLAFALDS